MAKYSIHISPQDIQERLKREFPSVKSKGTLMLVPFELKREFDKKHKLLRDMKRLQENHSLDNKGLDKVAFELLPFRGEFDSNVNAYRIDRIIPRKLFEEGRKKGFIFPIRFKDELLEEHLDGILIWYISEKVSI